MQACQAYQSCCVCTHSFSSGPNRKLNYDGFRRFLAPDSRGRHTRVRHAGLVFEYKDIETRPLPTYRDNDLVRSAVAVATQRRRPFLGHKCKPLLRHWPGYSWYRYNSPDLMHDSKLAAEMFLSVLVGRGGEGGYKSWSKDPKHRIECQQNGVFEATWSGADSRSTPLPWRIPKRRLLELDAQMGRCLWPHYVDRLHYGGASFWIKPGRLWKAHRKVCLTLLHLTSFNSSPHHSPQNSIDCFTISCQRSCGTRYQLCAPQYLPLCGRCEDWKAKYTVMIAQKSWISFLGPGLWTSGTSRDYMPLSLSLSACLRDAYPSVI